MRYVSTRGGAAPASFEEVLLKGLAPDGGLYVPEAWPRLSQEDLEGLQGRPYTEVAYRVLAPFIGEAIEEDALKAMIAKAAAAFDTDLVVPLVQLGPSDWLLELFHGPTLAFKDVALQLLGHMFEHVLVRSGQHITLVCATSGDTGSAAIEAIKGRKGMEIVVLHPEGRVSEVQRRQMTTASEANVLNIAVAGTFDDCQRLVKELFADRDFSSELGLSGVNSINWARIAAQAVYYFTSGLALGALDRPVSFVVPTGNFGDIYAGYVAMCMGLPVKHLVIASNINDILVRTLKKGCYEIEGVKKTTSPSMDIEVSSNFERLVFEATGRDGAATAALFGGLKQSGAFELPASAREEIAKSFAGERADEAEVGAAIAAQFRASNRLVDPHTAVAITAAQKQRHSGAFAPSDTVVVLATAHAAKFPDAVEAATGVRPALPARMADLFERKERFERMSADAASIKALIRARARAL